MSYPGAETKSSDFSFAFCSLKSCRGEGLQDGEAKQVMGISEVPLEIWDKECAFFLHAMYAWLSHLAQSTKCGVNYWMVSEEIAEQYKQVVYHYKKGLYQNVPFL